jgi:hypothetical protein
MSEKVAKALRKEAEANEIVGEFHITARANGRVEIHGPIGNLLFFRQVMNIAEKAVLDSINEAIINEKIKQTITGVDPTKFMQFPNPGKAN